jgi:hypothetical protein
MPLPLLPLVGLGLGLAGSIGKLFGRGKANRQMRQLMKENPIYKENPLAKQRLGYTQALLNARMPGAAAAERNIFANQAGQIQNINKVATDSSQALALATGTQGVTNNSFENLSQAENQDQQRRYGNVVGAENAVINEQDKVFQDQVRRLSDKAQLQGAINANKQNTMGDISNFGFSLMDFGLSGGAMALFGQKKKNGSASYGGGYDENSDYSDFQSPFE